MRLLRLVGVADQIIVSWFSSVGLRNKAFTIWFPFLLSYLLLDFYTIGYFHLMKLRDSPLPHLPSDPVLGVRNAWVVLYLRYLEYAVRQ